MRLKWWDLSIHMLPIVLRFVNNLLQIDKVCCRPQGFCCFRHAFHIYKNLIKKRKNVNCHNLQIPPRVLALSPLSVNFEDRWWSLQTIWIQMKPHITWGFIWDPICLTLYLGGNNDFLHLLKEQNIWKNYPACKELSMLTIEITSESALMRSSMVIRR